MLFDQDNPVIKLCAKGMELEGSGKAAAAGEHFLRAWVLATTALEKFTSAHYVARHQETIADKLKWDQTALEYALKIDDESAKSTLPSLYLNIGKGYEDLGEVDRSRQTYEDALSFVKYLPDDGYGSMIRSGITSGLARVT